MISLKAVVKRERRKNNAMFVTDEGAFYKRVNSTKEFKGEPPAMERFVEFWGGMWEEEKIAIEQPWMEKIKKLRKKIRDVQDIEISEETKISHTKSLSSLSVFPLYFSFLISTNQFRLFSCCLVLLPLVIDRFHSFVLFQLKLKIAKHGNHRGGFKVRPLRWMRAKMFKVRQIENNTWALGDMEFIFSFSI